MPNMTAADYTARLLEFAEFMEKLPPEKFDHTEWCEPDHTCKTTACIAGWATIKYSKLGKLFIKYTYEQQRTQARLVSDNGLTDHQSYLLERKRDRMARRADDYEPDWEAEGRRVLGLNEDTAGELFMPGSAFWLPCYCNGYRRTTNEQVALTMRYLAYKPFRRLDNGEVFDQYRMQAYIVAAQERASAV